MESTVTASALVCLTVFKLEQAPNSLGQRKDHWAPALQSPRWEVSPGSSISDKFLSVVINPHCQLDFT